MHDKRNQYWGALLAVRTEYRKAVGDNAGMTGPTMTHWVEQKYGLRIGLDGSGNYTQYYDVVDPKKFMFFRLKYFR
jgi:hypothetical protein